MGTPAPYLVEEILEEILVRLPTPAALARASTACVSFRRIITARSFLRRFRELHPPPLLGFAATNGGFNPVQEPHPSAPLARALADAADFSYSYVPKPDEGVFTPWSPCDVRDGRVLLVCDRLFRRTCMDISRKVLAVCDPLSRRYVLLPPIPVDLQESPLLEGPFILRFDPVILLGFEAVLAPVVEDEDETSFRVICWANYKSKFVIFVFSSATGKWCVAASPCWSSFGTVETSAELMCWFNYFRGNLYWTAPWGNKLLVFDTCSMEFSTVDILTSYHMQSIDLPDQSRCISSLVVVATEGALEMFTLVEDRSLTNSHCLYHITQKNKDHPSNKCELVNLQVLPRGYYYYIVGASEGFLFLQGLREIMESGNLQGRDADDLFSLDVKTSELKKVHGEARCSLNAVHPYFGFPPSLSKPSL